MLVLLNRLVNGHFQKNLYILCVIVRYIKDRGNKLDWIKLQSNSTVLLHNLLVLRPWKSQATRSDITGHIRIMLKSKHCLQVVSLRKKLEVSSSHHRFSQHPQISTHTWRSKETWDIEVKHKYMLYILNINIYILNITLNMLKYIIFYIFMGRNICSPGCIQLAAHASLA